MDLFVKELKISALPRNKRLRANNVTAAQAISVSNETANSGRSWLENYFTFDAATGALMVSASIATTGGLKAYATSPEGIGSIFDALPIATTAQKGIVQIGAGINVNNGVISLDQSVITPQTLSFNSNTLSISGGNSVDLSGLTPDLTGYALESWVSSNFNKYVHPATHPASMISTDSLRRFITDTERTQWAAAYGWGNHSGLYLGITSKAADSDKLDGYHASDFPRKAESATVTGSWNFTQRVASTNTLAFYSYYDSWSWGVYNDAASGFRIRNLTGSYNSFLIGRDNTIKIPNKLRIGDGNTPTEALDVVGNGRYSGGIYLNGLLTNVSPAANTLRVDGYGLIGNRGNVYISNSSSTGKISFNIGIHGAGIKANITSAGLYIGGNSIPTQALDVNGNALISGSIYLTDTNTQLLEGAGSSVKVQTNSGWLEIGAQNTSWTHFKTDRAAYWFDKTINCGNDRITSYSSDFQLQRQGSTKLTLGDTVNTSANRMLIAGLNAGKYISVGGDPAKRTTSIGTISVTNGNMHLDSATGYNMYINYYNRYPTYFGSSLYVGNTSDSANRAIVIQSKADAGIVLDADTDNVTETHNPYIHFKQDGGAVGTILGLNETDYDAMQNTVSGVATNSFVFHNLYSTSNFYFAVGGVNRFTVGYNGKLVTTNNIIRSAHNSGHLEGSYNNIGSNGAKTNPIYTIGSSYNPNEDTLGNMFGVGFANGGMASFLSSFGGSWGMYVASAGVARIFLDAQNGNIKATGTVQAYSTSDKRLKTNIKPLTNALNVINKINIYSFDYNDKGKQLMSLKDSVYDNGVIAQELEQIPELMHIVGPIYDKFKGVKYEKLIPYLIGAIKELSNEIKELKKN